MAVKISKGAIVPAKHQMVIEWDGDTTDLHETSIFDVPMWRAASNLIYDIEALRNAVIYLSDGNIEIIDDKAFSSIFCNAEKRGTEIVFAGNKFVRVVFRESGSSAGSTMAVYLFKDKTRDVKKLVLPNAGVQFSVGRTVREDTWCVDYEVCVKEAGGYVVADWLDEKGQPRRILPGRTYRVIVDGREYVGKSSGNVISRKIDIDNTDISINNARNSNIFIFANDTKPHKISITEIVETNPVVADAAGSAPTAEEFNALLTALRNAGILAT